MKRSRPRPSSTKAMPKAKAQRPPVELSSPPIEEWKNIVRDCKLTTAQAATLKFTLKEAIDEISRHQAKLKTQPDRALLVDRLKKFDKALNRLLKECRRSAHLMNVFLPSNTLAYISQSMTFSTMSEALGRNVFPINFDKKTTLASLERGLACRARNAWSQAWPFDPDALSRTDPRAIGKVDRVEQAE